ncbi:MAG: hypothetical protein AAGK32_00545 [Actinomycetota bacterium]
MGLTLGLLAGACGYTAGDGADGGVIADQTTVDPGVGIGSGARAGASGGARHLVPVGVAVKGADPAAVAQLAETARARPGIVRVFARWDTPFPGPHHQALLDAGYPIHLSVRPRTDGGRVIPWAELATAADDAPVIDELRAWLTTAAAHDGRIYFTLNHEPETSDSAGNGTATDYVAAWRRMVEVRNAVTDSATVPTVFVVGRGVYDSGEVERWYPGDDVVDVIGADAYNWYDCQGTDRAWIDPEPLLAPALDFAVAHGKRLAIPEIGSAEDGADPGRKAVWIRALGQYLADDEVAPHVEFVAWFSVHDRSWPDCDWAYDSSPLSAAAFGELLRWSSS